MNDGELAPRDLTPGDDPVRRILTGSSKSRVRAVPPLLLGLMGCVTLPPVVGIPFAAVLGLLAVIALVQAAYAPVVVLDEEGFSIETAPWLRPRLVLWSGCSVFTLHVQSDFVRSRYGEDKVPDTVRYRDSRYARRRPVRAWIVA